MLVFLDVLGPWGLKMVYIDPPSGTPPGIKILKNPPQNRKNPNHRIFRLAGKLNFIRNRHLKRPNRPTGSGARPVFVSRQVFRHHRR